MKEVINLIKSHLDMNDSIIIGCSGGSDSMCLLSLLVKNFKDNRIVCAHINHKVREQSEEEYVYVKEYCENHGVIFEGIEIPQVFNTNFEAQARKFRYSFYEQLSEKYEARYIMTAHHSDDLIETVLMRISRGSTLSGYAGIKIFDGKYFRPLLLVNKEEILNYLSENNINYYEDSTNALDEHTRNRYRHNIIPSLKKECKKISQKYLKFSKELQDYDNFVQEYIAEKQLIVNNKIIVDKLLLETVFIQKKTIELLVKEIQKKDTLDICDKNIEDIISVVNSPKTNSSINLSNNYIAYKTYNILFIDKKNYDKSYCVNFDGNFNNEHWTIKRITESSEKNNFILRINSSEVTLPLIVRTRKSGDVMNVKNLGSKKIKDIYIDSKVDPNIRDSYPLVTDSDNKILWIPGIKKSKFDKEKNEKYDIILYSERKDIDE